MGDITQLLVRSPHDPAAREELYRRIQDELTSLARRHRRGERNDPLMETMDLVNLAFLRLARVLPAGVKDRAHLYRLFSKAMERVLIDHARYIKAKKRGGGQPTFEVREGDWITEEEADHVLGVGEILEEIDTEYPIDARIYREWYFGGKKARDVVAILADEPGFQGLGVDRVKRAVEFIDTLVRDRIKARRSQGPDA